MVVFFSPQAAKELRAIRDELVGIRIATERIATALETKPEREPVAVEWSVGAPEQEIR